MHNAQLFAENIKKQAKNRNVGITKMCKDLGISVNAVSNIASGKDVTYTNVIRIADYLECSLDGLLGRSVSSDLLTDTEKALLTAFRVLSPNEQGQVIGFAHGLAQSNKNPD